uniref:Putative secreted protein n=1 Tax=Ixodes ricinus TaxID=34613 RepID=A0A6B0UUE8_IXORI
MASRISRTWKQTASRVALAMCAFVVNWVNPQIMPRASGCQYGAYSPAKAGTKHTPWELFTVSASFSTSELLLMMDRLSLSQRTAAPAMATEPSNAYCTGRFGPSLYATVVRRPWFDCTISSPVLYKRKQPVPYVHLAWPMLKHS